MVAELPAHHLDVFDGVIERARELGIGVVDRRLKFAQRFLKGANLGD